MEEKIIYFKAYIHRVTNISLSDLSMLLYKEWFFKMLFYYQTTKCISYFVPYQTF